jgi:hypothetical protein
MAETTVRTELECSADDYWHKCMLSEEYSTKLYLEFLKFPGFKWLSMSQSGDKTTRKLHIDPPVTGLPGPVKKVIGDSFSYVEEGTYDAATKRYSFKVTPSTAADKTTTTGEAWCEDVGGKTVLFTRLKVEVKIFMVGGLVEDKILSDFKASLQAAAPFINSWAKQHQ